jgi:hypothetical protein
MGPVSSDIGASVGPSGQGGCPARLNRRDELFRDSLESFYSCFTVFSIQSELSMGSVPHVALAVVCIPSVGFLLWFLVGLARDEKRERDRRLGRFLSVAHGSSERGITSATATPGWSVYQHTAAGFETAGSSFDRRATLARTPAHPHVCVLRLADQRAENTVKLRWLIMTLVLSAGVGAAMENSSQAAAGSSVPVLRITGPLEPRLPIRLIPAVEPASWRARDGIPNLN